MAIKAGPVITAARKDSSDVPAAARKLGLRLVEHAALMQHQPEGPFGFCTVTFVPPTRRPDRLS